MSQARARARSSSAARVVAWAFGIAARPHTKCRHGARGGPRPPPRPGHKRQAGSSNAALAANKVAHTLAWSSIESCMVYVLYAGFARRSDRKGRHGRRGRGRGEPDLRSRARSPTSTYPGGSPTTFPPSTRRSSPSRPSSMDETSASRDAGTGGQDASEAIASGRRRLLAAGVAAAGLAARYAVGRARVDRAK